ncbi:MAG: D-alanyl-D-alanine carboxypeptidase [Zetaproteobacteria bacterium]|nr:MAG: D-alanyl-D-alanine carboxypeptidase [Zetaproteobacteria bacterium]
MPVRIMLALLVVAFAPLFAQASEWPAPPGIQAKAWAVIDARTGTVLAQKDGDRQLPPASLTKMMTLYLAFEDLSQGRLKPDEVVSVSNKAWKIGGSTMFLEPRMKPTVEQLLHGIATLSGNDACIALAEHVAGTEEAFVSRMNEKARALGMNHTHFVNATGFPAKGHYSSPLDMAKLGAALWRDFPQYYDIFSEREYSYAGHTQPNRNRLLWSYPGADGIKTGHTQEAGYCLVGSAEKEGNRFVAAVFGTDSDRARAAQTKALLQYAFRNFVTVRPAERKIRRQVEVFSGSENHVWLKPKRVVEVTVPRGAERKLAFRLRYDAPIMAPIKAGQTLGTIDAVLKNDGKDGKVLASIPMVAARDVPRASWFGRTIDALRLWWRGTEEQDEASATQ